GITGEPLSPASYATAITVGAFTPALKGASFSNYGAGVDIAAPGTQIYSTVLNNGYDGWQGTSMASPHVAGVAGLLKAMNLDITAEQIRLYLTDKELLTVPSGYDHTIHGEGFLNALKPLQKIADDFALFKPKLQIAPGTLYFPNGNAYQDVAILSKSTEAINQLSYRIVYNNQEVNWLKIRKSDQYGVTPSRLGVYVDKMAFASLGINSKTTLTADIYFSGVGVDSQESVDEVTLPITVEYDPTEEMHPVVTVQIVENGNVVYTTYTGYDEGYYFSWPQEFSNGTIFAGSDLDNDGQICDAGEKYCGRLGGFLDANGGAIQNGQVHRIDVSFFEVAEGFIPVPSIENFISIVNGGQVQMSLDLLSGPSVILEALAKPANSSEAPVVVTGLSGQNAAGIALVAGSQSNSLVSTYAKGLNLTWDSST
ncbi:S8 family serine peptidase, partial [bacterium]|nr:S8 family serine peptidase [bacterium]